ncbi:MAG TPA: hypothetical protein VE093_19390 [Polyangiaceae bacterium]|jgi:hypothetical protein|nr:hypothetical protein [Polyangiaceae bacterium]
MVLEPQRTARLCPAGLLEWDELCAEAAFCDAAPWPNPEYDAMVDRREAAEAAAHQALSDVVRAHIACPFIEGRNERTIPP